MSVPIQDNDGGTGRGAFNPGRNWTRGNRRQVIQEGTERGRQVAQNAKDQTQRMRDMKKRGIPYDWRKDPELGRQQSLEPRKGQGWGGPEGKGDVNLAMERINSLSGPVRDLWDVIRQGPPNTQGLRGEEMAQYIIDEAMARVVENNIENQRQGAPDRPLGVAHPAIPEWAARLVGGQQNSPAAQELQRDITTVQKAIEVWPKDKPLTLIEANVSNIYGNKGSREPSPGPAPTPRW